MLEMVVLEMVVFLINIVPKKIAIFKATKGFIAYLNAYHLVICCYFCFISDLQVKDRFSRGDCSKPQFFGK